MTDCFIPEGKKRFSIGDASKITQVPRHTLRYWEKTFQIVRPIRLETGHRRFTREDLETIFKIKTLVGQKKFTLGGVKRELALAARGGGRSAEPADAGLLKRLKKEVRAALLELE